MLDGDSRGTQRCFAGCWFLGCGLTALLVLAIIVNLVWR